MVFQNSTHTQKELLITINITVSYVANGTLPISMVFSLLSEMIVLIQQFVWPSPHVALSDDGIFKWKKKPPKQTPAPPGSCNNSSLYAALNSVATAQICGKAISLKDVFNKVLAETPPKLRSQKDLNAAAQFGAAHEGQIWAKPAGPERLSSPKLLHWMRGKLLMIKVKIMGLKKKH